MCAPSTSIGQAPVVQQACPLFVPMAEEGLTDGPIAEAVAHRYLDPLMATMPRPRALVLGCTHFPVLKAVIARVVGDDVILVDSAATTAEAVAQLLAERGLARSGQNGEPHRFLATDAPDRFARVGEIFLRFADRSGQRGADRPSIIHPHQIKPVGRRHRTAAAAILRRQRLAHLARCHLPSPTSFSEPTIERT